MGITRRRFTKLLAFFTANISFKIPDIFGSILSDFQKLLKTKNYKRLKIKAMGIGWAGCNVINYMSKSGINDIEYIAISSDPRILEINLCPNKILLGKNLLRGEFGYSVKYTYYEAIQNKKKIKDALAGSECVFIIAGMGGKTGTGVAPVVAQISKELDALTIGVVITPFIFEGKRRSIMAEKGIEKLKKTADAAILIPNQAMLELIPSSATLTEAFKKSDEVCYLIVKAFKDLFLDKTTFMDLQDIKKVYFPVGITRVGIGYSEKGSLKDAIKMALDSPLFEKASLKKAKNIFCAIYFSGEETLNEISEAIEMLPKKFHKDAKILWKGVIEPEELPKAVIFAGGYS